MRLTRWLPSAALPTLLLAGLLSAPGAEPVPELRTVAALGVDLVPTLAPVTAVTLGGAGAYDVAVTHLGGSQSLGEVVLRTPTPGATLSGTGWTCAGATCTVLSTAAPGQALPPLRLSLPAATAPGPQAEVRVQVEGGGMAGVRSVSLQPDTINAPGEANPTLEVLPREVFRVDRPGLVDVVVRNRTPAVLPGPHLVVVDIAGNPRDLEGPGWVCGVTACEHAGALAPGAALPPLTVTTRAGLVSRAVRANLDDPDHIAGADWPVVSAGGPVALHVAVDEDTYDGKGAAFAARGELAVVQFDVLNEGGQDALGGLLQLVTSPGLSLVEIRPGVGVLCLSPPLCSLPALAPGESVPVAAVVAVAQDAPGTLSVQAVSSAAGAVRSATVPLVLSDDGPDLIATTSRERYDLTGATHVVRLANVGTRAYAGRPEVEVPLISASTSSGAGWSCSASGLIGRCLYDAPLGPGQRAPDLRVTTDKPGFSVRVDPTGDAEPSDNEARLGLAPWLGGAPVPLYLDVTPPIGPALLGRRSAFTVVAGNADGTSLGTVTVPVPGGATAAGAGWACLLEGVTERRCTTTAALPANGVTPPLTIGVLPAGEQLGRLDLSVGARVTTLAQRSAFAAVSIPLVPPAFAAGVDRAFAPPVVPVRPAVAGGATTFRPFGTTGTLSGTARPGARVDVLVQRGGKGPLTDVRDLVADARGRWTTTYGVSDDLRFVAVADGLRSPVVSRLASPVITSPSRTVRRGAVVTLTGRGTPGSGVVIRLRHSTDRPGAYPLARAARVGANGVWALRLRADRTYAIYSNRGGADVLRNSPRVIVAP